MEHDFRPDFCGKDVHNAFELSYANYLTVPRVLLEQMPAEWQHEFTALMARFHETFPKYEENYTVRLKGEGGRFKRDPLSQYRHPNREAIEVARGNQEVS